MAQISEFSLILAALGLSLGHLEKQTVGLITLVGLITISISTYMILYSHWLYERLAPWMSIFERKVPYREIDSPFDGAGNIDVLVVGLGRYGASLAAHLRERGSRLLAVDFDPTSVQQHLREGYMVHYGDVEDPEFIATLPLSRIQWVVSTVRDRSINRMLVHGLREQGYTGKVAVATSSHKDPSWFEKEGVDLTLIPFADAAKEAAIKLMPNPVVENKHTGDKP